MRYERLLAVRYIRAQKRQSVFTVISIAAAVALMTMFFLLYSVCMNGLEITYYSAAPYHLEFSELTEAQAMAMADLAEVKSVKMERTADGVTAYVLFDSDIGDRELWLQNAAKQIGAGEKYEHSKYSTMHGSYQWNNDLMKMDGVYDDAHLVKLRIFCIFFIFAVLAAVALRLMIDTAFEVSSKERERHYGVLQSVGATPEQIVRIITSEGVRLCIVAVPLGLLAGTGLAFLMYRVLLSAGISDLFQGMSSAKVMLPFSVDPLMLLVAAAVGAVWVFLSAYGVGMRIVKKAPMEAINGSAENVEKVRKHTLSGLLFGISGSIASRNARRQKKRFRVTVLTLTVSLTVFALFSTLTETVENSITGFMANGMHSGDFIGELEEDPDRGITYEDSLRTLTESGLFRDIGVSVLEKATLTDAKEVFYVEYMNRTQFAASFGENAPVSYDELVRTGGYLVRKSEGSDETYVPSHSEKLSGETAVLSSLRFSSAVSETDQDEAIADRMKNAGKELIPHTVRLLGRVEETYNFFTTGSALIGALETYQDISDEWYGDRMMPVSVSFSAARAGNYNAADHRKCTEWLDGHTDTVTLLTDLYETKWKMHSLLASVRAGVLILNLLIALAALINLLNIISTGIANRRSELASLQCVGMTDRQLDRMAIIECLQFAGAAAFFSVIICALLIFATETGLQALINASFVEESEATRKMLTGLVRIDRITPFVRIGLASLTAFAAGCVASLAMLRKQNRESLADRVRGAEMEIDTKKSHILRNSILALAGAFVLVIAGLRIYSVTAYRHDRDEYAKAGYLDPVESNGFRMNVYATGAEHGKHTVVGLAGMGVMDYPIVTKALNERLGKENTLVYPDRAGYGFSDDSLKKQSLEQVVEDYRAGLKNAGFEAPYVLMGHSYGDFYALWWQMNYPDEVEAIIILDGTWLEKNEFWESPTVDEFPSESDAYAEARRAYLRSWLGLDRLFPPEEQTEGTWGKAVLSAEQLRLSDLTGNRYWTAALISELVNEREASRELREILKPTDTPKLYFSTLPTCEADIREEIRLQNADITAAGKKPDLDPEEAASSEWARNGWYYNDIYENSLNPFLERCGNCRLVSVAGDHGLFYVQKCDEVADTILAFLAEITE